MSRSLETTTAPDPVAKFLPVVAAALGQIEGGYTPPPGPVTADQELMADLGLASLDIMKLALQLESELNITMEEDAEFQIDTVGQLCHKLAELTGDAQPTG